MAILLSVDMTAMVAGRGTVRAAWAGVFGLRLAGFANEFLPPESVAGPQLALALVLAFLFVGAYRAGHLWKQPVRILGGVALAVSLALYADLWHGNAVLVLVRGAAIWLALGLLLVSLRNATGWLTRRVPRTGLEQRVLEIRGANAPESPDLGPRYRTLAMVKAHQLPEDVEGMQDWVRGGVDTILISGEVPASQFVQIADLAVTHGCHLLTLPRRGELVGLDPQRIWVEGVPLCALTTPSLRASQLVIKRGLDIVGAAVLLVLLLPLMALVALGVKLTSTGPVLFRHRRAGLGGRFFWLLKFRSMHEDAERRLRADALLYQRYVRNDYKLPEDEDPRVTSLGRFLRKSSLDELPQLFNVLRGDLSLVGPRPVIEDELEMYRGRIPTLLSVKPGITGPWQISGRSNIAFPARARLDLEYVRNWSLIEDLWILFMTLPAVLLRRGAY